MTFSAAKNVSRFLNMELFLDIAFRDLVDYGSNIT